MTEPKWVLIVCMGNICRSPVGEAIVRKRAEERGLGGAIVVDSAGTINYHAGEMPDPRMREAAGRHGYELSHRARQINSRDLDRFDLILAMDRENLADIRQMDAGGRHAGKVRLLSEFIPECPVSDVPDPYYGGGEGFDRVIEMVESACGEIFKQLFPDDGNGGDAADGQ
jgi:protein-tyrosine phosphatase